MVCPLSTHAGVFRWGVKELFAEKIDDGREISYDDKQLRDILAQGFQLNVRQRMYV